MAEEKKKNIYKALDKEYDRDLLLRTIADNAEGYAQYRLNLLPGRLNIFGKVKEEAFDVNGFHNALLDVTSAIASGKLSGILNFENTDGTVWTDPLHRAALDLVSKSINALDSLPEKEKKKYSKDNLKEKFSNTFYGGNFTGTESDFTPWKNGNLGKNDLAQMISSLIDDLNNNDELDYDGSPYKSREDHIAKLTKLRDNLSNDKLDESDYADWIAAGGDGDFFRTITGLKAPHKNEYEEEWKEQELKYIDLGYTPELLADAKESWLLAKKKEVDPEYETREEEKRKKLYNDKWDLFTSKWTGTSLKLANLGTDVYDRKDFIGFKGKDEGDYTPGWFDDKNNQNYADQLYNNILQGKFTNGNSHGKSDAHILREYMYQMIRNKKDSFTPIKNHEKDQFFINSTFDLNTGTAIKYDTTSKTFTRVKVDPHNTPTLLAKLEEMYKKLNPYQKSTSSGKFGNLLKKGGKVEDLKHIRKAGFGAEIAASNKKEREANYNKAIAKESQEKYGDTSKESISRTKLGHLHAFATEATSKKNGIQEGLDNSDWLRIASLGQDLASIFTSYAGPHGMAASGILGLTSMGTDLVADLTDDTVSSDEVLHNALWNVGYAAAGMIPGGAGKIGKIWKSAKKLAPTLMSTYGAISLTRDPEVLKSLSKLIHSGKANELTSNDWKNITRLVKTIAFTHNSAKGASLAYNTVLKNSKLPLTKQIRKFGELGSKNLFAIGNYKSIYSKGTEKVGNKWKYTLGDKEVLVDKTQNNAIKSIIKKHQKSGTTDKNTVTKEVQNLFNLWAANGELVDISGNKIGPKAISTVKTFRDLEPNGNTEADINTYFSNIINGKSINESVPVTFKDGTTVQMKVSDIQQLQKAYLDNLHGTGATTYTPEQLTSAKNSLQAKLKDLNLLDTYTETKGSPEYYLLSEDAINYTEPKSIYDKLNPLKILRSPKSGELVKGSDSTNPLELDGFTIKDSNGNYNITEEAKHNNYARAYASIDALNWVNNGPRGWYQNTIGRIVNPLSNFRSGREFINNNLNNNWEVSNGAGYLTNENIINALNESRKNVKDIKIEEERIQKLKNLIALQKIRDEKIATGRNKGLNTIKEKRTNTINTNKTNLKKADDFWKNLEPKKIQESYMEKITTTGANGHTYLRVNPDKLLLILELVKQGKARPLTIYDILALKKKGVKIPTSKVGYVLNDGLLMIWKQGGKLDLLKELRNSNFTSDNSQSSSELSKYAKGGIIKAASGTELTDDNYVDDIWNGVKFGDVRYMNNTSGNGISERKTNATDTTAPGNNHYDPVAGVPNGENKSNKAYWNYMFNNPQEAEKWARGYKKHVGNTTDIYKDWFDKDDKFQYDKFKNSTTQKLWSDKLNGPGHDVYKGKIFYITLPDGTRKYVKYSDTGYNGYKISDKARTGNDINPLIEEYELIKNSSTDPSVKPGVSVADSGTLQNQSTANWPNLAKLAKYTNAINKALPTAFDTAKFFSNKNNNDKAAELDKTKEVALLSPIYKHRNIYGDFGQLLAYNRKANEIMSLADRTASQYMSPELAMAYKLEALTKANDTALQGGLIDDKAIADSREKANTVANEVYDYNHEAADLNMARMIAKHNHDIDVIMGRNSANTTNWNNYLSTLENRILTENNDKKQRLLALYKENMQNWLKDRTTNDPEYLRLYDAYYNETDSKKSDELRNKIYEWNKTRTKEIEPILREMNYRYIMGNTDDLDIFNQSYGPYRNYEIGGGYQVTPSKKSGGKITVDSSRMKASAEDLKELRKLIKHSIDTNQKALDNLSRATLLELKKMMGI